MFESGTQTPDFPSLSNIHQSTISYYISTLIVHHPTCKLHQARRSPSILTSHNPTHLSNMTIGEFFWLDDAKFQQKIQELSNDELMFGDKHNVRKRKGEFHP